jgi:hypothetical protein
LPDSRAEAQDRLVETLEVLSALTRFARGVKPDLPEVARALSAVRALFAEAGVPYRIVGGIAVVHHGYERTTKDVDVIVSREYLPRLEPLLAAHGFSRPKPNRLLHGESGALIDLLFAGDPIPRSSTGTFPRPEDLDASTREPDIVALGPLLALKLESGRRQDEADIVALLKPMSDGPYWQLEAEMPAHLRPRLAELRRDAEEERSWETD